MMNNLITFNLELPNSFTKKVECSFFFFFFFLLFQIYEKWVVRVRCHISSLLQQLKKKGGRKKKKRKKEKEKRKMDQRPIMYFACKHFY